jgi:hypothetical protein
MRFKQDVPPATIETAAGSTRTWTVKAGTEVYFRTPTADTNVIAGLNNESANLGCVTATVSQAGVGFTPATFAAINRSRKEVTITPTTGATTTSYDVNFYMTNTELNSVAPATLYLLRTTSATDAGITGANTTIVTPTLITGTNYVGFKGTFTGFGRYFLTDGPLCSTPTTTVTVTGATTFCTGGSVTLTAAGGTGYTYQWQLAGAPISGATNATYVATGTGSYDVVVTQGSCSATSTATAVTALTVSAAPITGSGTVCLGGTATLTDATAGGTWSSSSTGVASITATGLVYGVSLGSATISYAVTNACGTAVVTSSISVVAPPTVAAITGTATACPGSSSTLSNATTGGTWSSSNTARATVSTTGVVTGVSSGSVTISYSVTNATGCTTSAVTTYNVLATPSAAVSASGPTTFCLGGNVTISVPTAAGVTYQWLSGGTPLTGATNASYTATTSGNYSVQVGNGTCTQTSSVVTVTATTATVVVPAVSITATPGFTLCTGMTSASFAAVPVNGGTTPTYNWYVNGIAAGTASTMSYSPAAGDIVKVVMRSSATCAFPDTAAGTGTMSFSPYVNPAVGISAVPGDTVCEGSVITLLAAPTYGGSTPTYRWTRNGANVATGPAYSYPPANGDVIKVYMRSNFLCRLIDSAESAPTTIVVDSNIANTITVTASQSSIRPGQSVTFTASAPHGGSSPVYQWYLNGSAITGATSNTYTTTTLVAGDIVTCKVTSSEPCASPATATSGGVSILVTSGIGTNGSGNTLIVVPNPNGGIFSIKGTIAAGNDGAATIRITNMLGQTIYQNAATTTNGQIDQLISLDGTVAAGVYQVNVITGSGSTVFQVVIEK